MIDLILYKAQDTIKSEPVPDITLHFTQPIPESQTLKELERAHDSQAQLLVDALTRVLPGGVLTRLTAKLMLRYAGLLVVPLDS
jgi:hypothetical protein